MRTVAVDVLIAVGVSAELVCCIGLLAMRDVFDRLHFAGAATTLGPLLILAAILLEHPHDSSGVTSILVVVVLLFLNPVLTNATARAGRQRLVGRIEATREELE